MGGPTSRSTPTVGHITSAIHSPRLKRNIGLPVRYAAAGTRLVVLVAGVGERPATVVPMPFIDPKKEILKA